MPLKNSHITIVHCILKLSVPLYIICLGFCFCFLVVALLWISKLTNECLRTRSTCSGFVTQEGIKQGWQYLLIELPIPRGGFHFFCVHNLNSNATPLNDRNLLSLWDSVIRPQSVSLKPFPSQLACSWVVCPAALWFLYLYLTFSSSATALSLAPTITINGERHLRCLLKNSVLATLQLEMIGDFCLSVVGFSLSEYDVFSSWGCRQTTQENHPYT